MRKRAWVPISTASSAEQTDPYLKYEPDGPLSSGFVCSTPDSGRDFCMAVRRAVDLQLPFIRDGPVARGHEFFMIPE